MPYVAFHDYFPEIAERETRTVTLLPSSPFKLPRGEYAFLEMYCDEPACDCRRVFFCVVSPLHTSPEAIVAYGWEPAEFYAKWARETDPEVIHQLKGPALNLSSRQSERAPEILRLLEEVVLQDPAYVARLKAHYALFRRQVDESKNPKRVDGPRLRRGPRPRRASTKRDVGETWITDMRDFLDEGALADLPSPALNLVLHLGAIVAWMTSHPHDGEQRTNVTCRRSPGRRRCVGEVFAAFQDDPRGIMWFCPRCGDNGLIHDWERTLWDRGGRTRRPAASESAHA
jgi:hypothetical protein